MPHVELCLLHSENRPADAIGPPRRVCRPVGWYGADVDGEDATPAAMDLVAQTTGPSATGWGDTLHWLEGGASRYLTRLGMLPERATRQWDAIVDVATGQSWEVGQSLSAEPIRSANVARHRRRNVPALTSLGHADGAGNPVSRGFLGGERMVKITELPNVEGRSRWRAIRPDGRTIYAVGINGEAGSGNAWMAIGGSRFEWLGGVLSSIAEHPGFPPLRHLAHPCRNLDMQRAAALALAALWDAPEAWEQPLSAAAHARGEPGPLGARQGRQAG